MMAMTKLVPIRCKTLLLKRKYLDDWFLSRYGLNLYRGCQHACQYCDGRSQRYFVHKDFGERVLVKVNASEVLARELARIKERAVIAIGGGVGDSYQPAERRYRLTRRVLELLCRLGLPCLILTKSDLVLRDVDILGEIQRQSLALVLFSIASLDQSIWSRFEPAASPPQRRLAAMEKIHRAGIPTGVMFVPILPFLSDSLEQLTRTIRAAKEHGAQFLMAGGLTLRDRQKEHYLQVLHDFKPELATSTRKLYPTPNGSPSVAYLRDVNRMALQICQELNMPIRIPHHLFKGRIDRGHEVALILMHLALFRELRGLRGQPFRSAALALQRAPETVDVLVNQNRLREVPGVGPVIERLVVEMVESGECEYYRQLAPWS